MIHTVVADSALGTEERLSTYAFNTGSAQTADVTVITIFTFRLALSAHQRTLYTSASAGTNPSRTLRAKAAVFTAIGITSHTVIASFALRAEFVVSAGLTFFSAVLTDYRAV